MASASLALERIERERADMNQFAGKPRGHDIAAMLEEAKSALVRCRSAKEICDIAHIHLDRLLPASSACVYVAHENGTRFVAPSVCACQRDVNAAFHHYECWAICRGAAHAAGHASENAPCAHVRQPGEPLWHHLCLPLRVGSRILGLLHIEHDPEKRRAAGACADLLGEANARLASDVAAEVASALARVSPAAA